MTTDLFMAYVHAIPRLHARRQLDAADVALYPVLARFAPEAASEWRRGLAVEAYGAEAGGAGQAPSQMRFNGVPMAPAALKVMLGAGLKDAFAVA